MDVIRHGLDEQEAPGGRAREHATRDPPTPAPGSEQLQLPVIGADGGRAYFPGAVWGAGPSLIGLVTGAGARRSYGLALGIDFADGH